MSGQHFQQIPFVVLQTATTADKSFQQQETARFLPLLPPSPVSPPAICLRLAFLVMLHVLCRLFPVSEVFVIAVNRTHFQCVVNVYGVFSNRNVPCSEKYFLHDLIQVAQAEHLECVSAVAL